MNVVIYARYSDPRQHESSIEVQIEQAEALAKEKGYSVVDYYIDRGITATDDKRPELQRLMRDSKKGLFSAVIVYKSDRFFRDNEKYYIYKHELSKNNVALLAVKERYEDSATGRFQESVVVALNQLFSEQSAERVTDGMRKTAEKGLFVGGAVPTGFKIERQEYVIDPNTAPIIKMIFEKYADGMNMKDIIDELNERGLKTSRGRPFTKNAFNGIIDNKRYTGCYIYKDIEIPDRIPRIISDEIWERVHLRRKRVRGTKGTRYNYLLTGKLYCGVCENLMYGYTGTSHTSEKYHYYKCSDRICKREWKYIPQQPLEDFVINHCRDILTDEHIAEIAHQNVTMSERESERRFYKQLKKNLKTAEKELEELGNVLSKGQEIDYILS
uniref:recombinase family protein n=1 Tax=Anaerosporobacter sp. TaxID=1872529 RepID=UPI00286F8F04